jgi:opacity protein-like surface antigen
VIKGLVRTIIVTLIIGNAPIFAHSGYYINVGGGAVFSNISNSHTSNSNAVVFSPTIPGASIFTLTDVNRNNQFNNGYDVNLALGKYFNACWHGDLEFLYQNVQREQFGTYTWTERNNATGALFAQQVNVPIGHVSNHMNIYSLFGNASYDFRNDNPFTPFVGGGIGAAWASSDRIEDYTPLVVNIPSIPLFRTTPAIHSGPSLSGAAFAWQVKAGIAYDWNPMTTLTLLYRLQGTGSFRASESETITNPATGAESHFVLAPYRVGGLLTHAFELSARFNV